MTGHTELILRPYQREAVDAIHDAHMSGMKSPAVVMPTGSGKTIMFSALAREHLQALRTRALVLVHRDELCDQAAKEIRNAAPRLHVGRIKAEDNDVQATVMIASVQTLSRDSRLAQVVSTAQSGTYMASVGLIITDEVHHSVAASYRKIYDAFPDANRAGFTATLARGDGAGLGDVVDDVVYTKTTLEMIRDGYLVDVRARTVDLELDLSAVKTSGGDYQAKSLGNALMGAGGPQAIARSVQQHAAGRRPVVFTPDIATAYATAAEMIALGISCGVVEGNTSREDRQLIYKRYRTGELTAIVNCLVLTEGWDAPWADCAVIARPTKSAPLYIQMVGRVLRTFPGKTDALVLNVVGEGGVIATLIDLDPGLVTAPEPGESLAEAYVRQEQRAETTVEAGHLAFGLRYRDVDLFAASSHAWLRTRAGVMFLPREDGEIFLWPERNGEGWMVGHAPARGGAWQPLHRDLPLGMAMAWAETEAGSAVFALSARDKRWRKEKAEARQIGKARSIGVRIDGPATKGEVSDAISIVLATHKFDERMRRLER